MAHLRRPVMHDHCLFQRHRGPPWNYWWSSYVFHLNKNCPMNNDIQIRGRNRKVIPVNIRFIGLARPPNGLIFALSLPYYYHFYYWRWILFLLTDIDKRYLLTCNVIILFVKREENVNRSESFEILQNCTWRKVVSWINWRYHADTPSFGILICLV